jgi:chromatin structure-remodeling complex protein RSC7
MLYPRNTQPTHARWEQFPSSEEHQQTNVASNVTVNGIIVPKFLSNGITDHPNDTPTSPTIFPPLKPLHARNFLIVDSYFESAPVSGLGIPGEGEDGMTSNGLCDITEDLLAELPEECRKAFDEAAKVEQEWRTKWTNEREDGSRSSLKITY